MGEMNMYVARFDDTDQPMNVYARSMSEAAMVIERFSNGLDAIEVQRVGKGYLMVYLPEGLTFLPFVLVQELIDNELAGRVLSKSAD